MMNKKERELALVESVRSRLAVIPDGPLTPHEAPDVLLKHPGGVLGLEVTNLYPKHTLGSSPVQAQESERRAIVDRARAKAEQLGAPPVLVAVHFLDSATLRKSERENLSRCIAHLVHLHHPPGFGIVSLKNTYRTATPLPRQLHSIGIHRQPGITRHSWSSSEADIVADEISGVIQGSIDEKAIDLPRYLDSCDQCHLVIASGFETFRPAYEASATTLAHGYNSPFSRTFYIEAFGGQICELKTRP